MPYRWENTGRVVRWFVALLCISAMFGCVINDVFAQSNPRRPTANVVVSRKRLNRKARLSSGADSSIGGISFSSLASDQAGGLWIGGQVLEVGLLLHLGGRVTSITLPNVSRVQDLLFTTQQTGWLITQGDLYRTNDAGKGWEKVEVDQQHAVKRVYFRNELKGWIVGEAGTIYSTNDRGQTWHKQNAKTKHDLIQIQFADALSGWVIGVSSEGKAKERVFLTTRDGGETWRLIPSPESPTIRAFSFVNDFLGWAIDREDNIVRTIDGGQTWDLCRLGGQDAWEDIYFINESEGWVAGDGIAHTRDGGATWEYQMLPVNRDGGKFFDRIYFSDHKRGWAVGFFLGLLTNDGGATWSPISEAWRQSTISRALKEMTQK